MELEFSGNVWFWRGPAPWHFVTVPEDECEALAAVSGRVSYGWGMIPATVTIGKTSWATALWPKNGGYIVPLRTDVRKREKIELEDVVTVRLDIST